MLISYKLPLAFDAEFLKADLRRICADEWVAHFNKGYYEGEWKGLALRSTTGKTNQLYRPPDDTREAVDTVVLARCPYFRKVLGAFRCPILTARLLSLSPGSKIREHQDYFLGFEEGMIRIHIPIVTDKRVDFFVGNQRLEMMDGEAWYIDFSLPHRVCNTSDKDRVHLVLDCGVNDWLAGMVRCGRSMEETQSPSCQPLQDQPTTAPKFDLSIVKEFFDAATCRQIVDDMRRSPVSAALTYGKGEAAVDERVRRARRVSPSADTVASVTRRLEEHRKKLEEHFGIELSGCEEPQFLSYREGDFFVAHQDGNTGLINLDTDRTRRISVTIFLNNESAEPQSDTYGGGRLVFSDWRTNTRQEVVGEAGMLVAFRSETTHEIPPITYGERFAIVSWYGQYPPR